MLYLFSYIHPYMNLGYNSKHTYIQGNIFRLHTVHTYTSNLLTEYKFVPVSLCVVGRLCVPRQGVSLLRQSFAVLQVLVQVECDDELQRYATVCMQDFRDLATANAPKSLHASRSYQLAAA